MSQPSSIVENITTSEDHDQEIEEYVWNLMNKCGLLSELKSQIAGFVQQNGQTKEKYSVDASKAHPNILAVIYEYLSWVGMKNTCAMLLSESPVQFDTKLKADEAGEKLQVPILCTLLNKKDSGDDGAKADTDEESLRSEVNNSNSYEQMEGNSKLSGTYGGHAGMTPVSPLNTTFNVGEGIRMNGEQQNNQAKSLTNGHTKVTENDIELEFRNGNELSSADAAAKEVFIPIGASIGSSPMYGKLESGRVTKTRGSVAEAENFSSGPSIVDILINRPNDTNWISVSERQLDELQSAGDEEQQPSKPLDSSKLPEEAENKHEQSEPQSLSEIQNPLTDSNVDFNDDSIADLLESTAEDMTQDVSIGSDSKALATTLEDMEHHVKLRN